MTYVAKFHICCGIHMFMYMNIYTYVSHMFRNSCKCVWGGMTSYEGEYQCRLSIKATCNMIASKQPALTAINNPKAYRRGRSLCMLILQPFCMLWTFLLRRFLQPFFCCCLVAMHKFFSFFSKHYYMKGYILFFNYYYNLKLFSYAQRWNQLDVMVVGWLLFLHK